MRRIAVLLAAAAVSLTAMPVQAEDGMLLAPDQGFTRLERCQHEIREAGTGNPNGVTGWSTYDVRPGQTFVLEPTGPGAAVNDFAIVFYERNSACTEDAPSFMEFNNAGAGGVESGVVPSFARYAIIDMYTGHPGATFRYRY